MRSGIEVTELKMKNLNSANERKMRISNEKFAEKDKVIKKFSEENDKLATDLSHAKVELSQCRSKLNDEKKKNAAKAETITRLSGENRHLLARLKQYQSNVVRHGNDVSSDSKSTAHKNTSHEYEVEHFLSHKVKYRKRYFLVHWKGYSSNHDSWESEENVRNCPKVLSAYLKANNLQP